MRELISKRVVKLFRSLSRKELFEDGVGLSAPRTPVQKWRTLGHPVGPFPTTSPPHTNSHPRTQTGMNTLGCLPRFRSRVHPPTRVSIGIRPVAEPCPHTPTQSRSPTP